MKLKNSLLVVTDLDRSVAFYPTVGSRSRAKTDLFINANVRSLIPLHQ